MKSVSVAAALLASAAVAQPHGHNHHRRHHEKRDLKVVWDTVYETVTVMVDDHSTETIYPSAATTSNSAGEFFQSLTSSSTTSTPTSTPTTTSTPSTSSTSTAAPTTLAQSPSTTSTTPAAAPTTSTTPVPVVVPTSVYVPPVVESPTTTAAAPPASTSSTSSSGGSTGGSTGANSKSGDMTYYTVGPGSCGYDDTGADNSKNIVAMGHEFWNSISTLTSYGVNQPANPLCDQEITISINGKSAVGVIRDMCPGCSGDSIDVSEALFNQLVGSTTAGRVEVSWYFNSGKW